MFQKKKQLAVILGVTMITLSGCDVPFIGSIGGGGGDMSEMEMMAMMGMLDTDNSIQVETAYPVQRKIAQTGEFIGTIETGEKVSVIPRVGGRVKVKNYSVGDHVNAGDVLFVIDDTDLLEEKKKAELDLKEANADLAKTKAADEATKSKVNETLNTIETKTMEYNNAINQAIRDEYSAQLSLYKTETEQNIHKQEQAIIDELIWKDNADLACAWAFTVKLQEDQAIYNDIASQETYDAARTVAEERYHVTPDLLPAEGEPADAGRAFLQEYTVYENIGEVEEAISSSTKAIETAKTSKANHEGTKRTNTITLVGDDVTAQKERGTIDAAGESTALKKKVAADYEMYTKAKIWAETQSDLAGSNATLVSSSAKVSKAESAVEALNRKLEYTSVTAPVSGEIVECKIEDFGLASDSTAAYTMLDTSKKKAVFYVTGDAKNNMFIGQTVTISKGDAEYNAIVDSISDSIDEKKLLFRITAALDENDMASFDVGAAIRLATAINVSENAMTVPISVIYYDEGRAFVYVAIDGHAEKTPVETGINDGTDIEIISGLSPDDQVIVNWSSQLQDNAEVTVTKAAEKSESVSPAAEEPVAEPAAAPEETDENAAAAEEAAPVYVETTAKVNVRKGPGTDAAKIDTVAKGTRLEKIGEENGWTKVLSGDQEAYISSDYVRECE